jgi:hypothetical protein
MANWPRVYGTHFYGFRIWLGFRVPNPYPCSVWYVFGIQFIRVYGYRYGYGLIPKKLGTQPIYGYR